MKLVLSLFFVLFISVLQAQHNVDILHYKYELRLSDSTDNIYGITTIYFKANKTTEFLELDFTNVGKTGKGMKITDLNTPSALGIRITAIPKSMLFTHENDKIKIKLPRKLLVGEKDTIAIEYKGIPSDGLIISKNKYGKRTFFADNWPNRAHNWIPCVDDPADKASVEFLITAPSHYQIISNGIQIEETNLPGNKKLTHYKEDVPLPTKVMVFGAADFAVNHVGDVGCVSVSSWVYPENKETGFFDYAQAKDILAWHNNYIGPYPYKKLANVQSKTKFGGMENAGAIFYAEEKITGKRQEEKLLSHEIVHQWFGNMATEKSFAHLWLSEGFATYLTHIYMEARYGTDSMNKEMKEDRSQVIDFVKYATRPVVDSTPDYMKLLSPNSYQKGSWVLHMLRRQLGDSIFKKSIRLYYSTYAGKNADTKDLQRIFETVSGKDLKQFFQQWLYTAENPILKISWKNIPKEKKVAITIEQVQNKIFELPLELSLATSLRKPVIEKITISKKKETFLISTNETVTQLGVDDNTSLLAEFSVQEEK